jgi:glc operon protein GlcG
MFKFINTAVVSTLVIAGGLATAGAAERPYLDNAAVAKVVQQAKHEIDTAKTTGCIAVVDEAGGLLFVQRLDNSPAGCVDAAIGKARTSALYHAPTLKLMQRVAAGETGLLTLPHAVPLGGGQPLSVSGTVIGGVGVSTPKQEIDNKASEAATQGLQ